MGIERDLHDLLFCHDCVIVPHWGGFLTHYRSASLDEGRQIVHPPGKDVSFNKNLDRNDGLLADHIAKRSGASFNDARASIDHAVKEWRHTLDHQGRLELPQIGIFYRDAERNLQFDPDRRSNFLKDAHGLRPVPAVPVKQAKETTVRHLPIPADSLTTYDRRTTFIWAAAAMAAVVFGAAAFWAYRLGDPQGSQWSGLDPLGEEVRVTYVPTDATPKEVAVFTGLHLPEGPLGIKEVPLSEDPNDRIIVDLGSPAPIAPAETTAVAMPEKKAVPTIRARFHVIGGCFAEEDNAERFLKDLQGKGFPAQRLPRYGELHPVAFGSYARREEALRTMATMRDQGISAAWLLVR